MSISRKSMFLIMFVLFISCAVIASVNLCNAAEQDTGKKPVATYLSDMKPSNSDADYAADKDVEGSPLQLGGMRYKKGLCVKAISLLNYNIDGKYSTFKAVVGNGDGYSTYTGKLTFTVSGDGTKLYESKPLAAKETDKISVKVEGIKILSLSVKSDGTPSAMVIWADAAVY